MSTQTLNISNMDDAQLTRAEREIAHKYMQGISWFMVAWPFVNVGVWFSLWYFVFSGAMSAWAAFPIAVLNMSLSYLPSHEAQHDIYARPGEPLRWLNQFIGHFSVIPLALSYRVLRETHLEHHKHTNDPQLDPDYKASAPNTAWGALWASVKTFQPNDGFNDDYADTLERLGTAEAMRGRRDQLILLVVNNAILFALAASGYAIEAALLWWLPQKLGIIYLRFFLSWHPHQPADKQGRYRDTHSFKTIWGVIGSSAMTAHIVHHLHPRIPLDRTPAALREMTPILRARGCDLAE